MIAGGVGITPMMSMVRAAADRRDPRPHRLVVVARNHEDLLFRDELGWLREELDLEVTEVLRRPHPGWEGHTGEINVGLLDGRPRRRARARAARLLPLRPARARSTTRSRRSTPSACPNTASTPNSSTWREADPPLHDAAPNRLTNPPVRSPSTLRRVPMQRRTSRNLSRAVVVAVILAVGATIWQSWTAGMPGMSGVVATQWGPLSPADRDLIVKVRLACLWEMSTGQQVQQQGTSPAVKEAGRKISAEHTDLDQKTRDIADKLGVLLPASPNAQQVAWMKEIAVQDRLGLRPDRRAAAARGPRDRAADPRGGADRHPQRRWSASSPSDGTLYVTRHIGYLESTGLVDYAALPEPQSPGLLSGLGRLDRPARARARPHRLPAGRHPDRREPARPQDGQGRQGDARRRW